jgi:hypothetical protein
MEIPNIIVPEDLTDAVVSFCRKVSPHQLPCYVPVEPEPYCRINFCFQNIAKKIEIDGGSIEYGWQVWMWPDVFIEAEFHSVWKSPDDIYVDITPKDDAHQEILFIPDSKKIYAGYSIDNIRQSISGNRLVDLYIAINECLFLIKNYRQVAYEYTVSLGRSEIDLCNDLTRWGYKIMRMVQCGSSRNASCPCGSGIRFKNCCGKELAKAVEVIKKKYFSAI